MARFSFKRKGRYVLLALALGGSWRALQTSPSLSQAPTIEQITSNPAERFSKQCLVTSQFSSSAEPAPTPPSSLSGRLGLWVAKIDPTTLQPLKAVAQDPDGIFPLASSYKQAVLWAVLQAVDAGTLKLTETFDVNLSNQSLGNYPFDQSNATTLLYRMIRNSDNTATDILHRRVGLATVQQLADQLGLCKTRLILPTKNWWVAQAELDPHWIGAGKFANSRGKAQIEAALSLDQATLKVRPDVLQNKLDHYFEERYDPKTDLGVHNVSTPAEFGHLIANEFLKPKLSTRSQALFREVMATGYGRSRLNPAITYFGGKGGNGWKILTLTGYFRTPRSEHVVYVFMQHGSHENYTLPHSKHAFKWINAAIDQLLNSN